MTAARLFAECVLPGCVELVIEAGETCPGCVAAFGPYLQLTDRPPLTAEQISERDKAVRDAYEQQARQTPVNPWAPERKANQRGWMCEERRTCTRGPMGWECDACRELR